jgi:hypothetical protein
MRESAAPEDAQGREIVQMPLDRDDAGTAWAEIEPGRFMPRRIRGSFRGGKLG